MRLVSMRGYRRDKMRCECYLKRVDRKIWNGGGEVIRIGIVHSKGETPH